MKNLFVTGLSGFVGQALKQYLSNDNEHGFCLKQADHKLELLNPSSIVYALKEINPSYVIHLAAQTFIPTSFTHSRNTFDINFYGTLNLLEALKEINFKGKLLFISSSEIYGLVQPLDLPITEKLPPKPRNPYAVSKAAAEALCYQWSQTETFDVVIARPFNHIGPGQSDRFVISDFAKQIAEIKHQLRKPIITTGDIDILRDFTDVSDVVNAYLRLLIHGQSGEIYNICSNKAYQIRQLIYILLDIAQINATTITDKNRSRLAEQKTMLGSFEKLNAHTHWQPIISIENSLQRIMQFWLKKCSGVTN